jgi:hypothetical protein
VSIAPTGLMIQDAKIGQTVCIAALSYVILEIVEDGKQYRCVKLHSKDINSYYFDKDTYLDYIS